MISGAEIFSALDGAFARAAEATGEVQCSVRLAGRPARYRVVGPRLARRALAPLAHLADAETSVPAALEVELYCEDETGTRLPFEPLPRGVYSDGDRWFTHSEPGIVTCLDREEGVIAGWRATAEAVPEEAWRSLSWVAPVWYLDHGVQILHAGLVAHGERGGLLIGESGAGKSTTTLACVEAGLQFLGDDHVGVEETSAGWLGHSVSCMARIAPETLAAHPGLAAGRLTGEAEGKTLIVMEPGRARASVPIRRLLLPRRPGTVGSDRDPSPRDVLTGLLPTSLTGIPGPNPQRMARLGRLARDVPASWIELAGSPADAAAAVIRSLEEAG